MKMRFLRLIVSAFVFMAMFSSCDEREIVIPEFVSPETDRVVVIEEMTGVSCQGCPNGSTKLQSLIQLFDGNVIGIGVHGDFLCEPVPDHSKYDFRFDKAKEIENSFFFIGKPAAIINRQEFDDQDFIGITNVDAWQQYVERELEKPNLLAMGHSHTYDTETREMEIEITGFPEQNVAGTFNITVQLLENHIIDAQKNGPDIQDDYEHMHVLRAVLTESAFGDNFDTDLEVGETISSTFTYTLPPFDGTWVEENIEVVAFVSRVEANSEEIIQGIQFHLVEE